MRGCKPRRCAGCRGGGQQSTGFLPQRFERAGLAIRGEKRESLSNRALRKPSGEPGCFGVRLRVLHAYDEAGARSCVPTLRSAFRDVTSVTLYCPAGSVFGVAEESWTTTEETFCLASR